MSWAEAEFRAIDLGDTRLNRRIIKIVEGLGLAPGRTIPQTFQSWSSIKACYNFFSNDLVSETKIVAPHFNQTIERIKEYPIVQLPNDTSELDYNSKEAMKGKERITNTKKGLWLHPTIAITPQRVMLGIVDVNFWKRKQELILKDPIKINYLSKIRKVIDGYKAINDPVRSQEKYQRLNLSI